jgi:hypothetical protein
MEEQYADSDTTAYATSVEARYRVERGCLSALWHGFDSASDAINDRRPPWIPRSSPSPPTSPRKQDSTRMMLIPIALSLQFMSSWGKCPQAHMLHVSHVSLFMSSCLHVFMSLSPHALSPHTHVYPFLFSYHSLMSSCLHDTLHGAYVHVLMFMCLLHLFMSSSPIIHASYLHKLYSYIMPHVFIPHVHAPIPCGSCFYAHAPHAPHAFMSHISYLMPHI